MIDFFPPRVEEFARPSRSSSEFDCLSDNEDAATSDEESSEDEGNTMAAYTKVKNWEWRFYLLLEDAMVSEGQKKRTLWVSINNSEAQYLTGLDASNLRIEKKAATKLRERLAVLWGDLETHVERRQEMRAKVAADMRKGLPPNASDAEEQSVEAAVQNRPFLCCIRQYGVKVPVQDDSQVDDAGEGFRWQRMYGLFGTKIQ